jgi:L-ascorbate metabolism protein UlaG (beta-lactamase superfamily)
MTPKEAAESALKINPKIAVPMHYGSGIGTEKEAQEFKKLLLNKLEVEVLTSIDK